MLVPGLYRRARTPLLCFGKVRGLLENLVLKRLASKRTFKLSNACHGILKIRSPGYGLIGTYGHQRSFVPLKQLDFSKSMLAGYQGNKTALFHGLFEDIKL